ncbi:hypothetical protein ST47_g9453 [Ascochyta rabiei]|uniref:Uncharacterized protein n=1 Tax=Didymella rabiei TaxID=5454 RepID=A0A162X8D8_DIDRA|nr:hypothetical protein ST47_g9453 [Ascochyta rabiei]
MDRWQPLSTSDQQIRLLEVAPREQDSKSVNCILKIVSLLSDPTYEALSYVWGEWEDSMEIILDGSKHTVTKNLHDALKVMQNANRPRTLWVDAVCIDQTNIQERTSQVAMMDKIYFQAEQVLVWLGERSKTDVSDKVPLYGKDHARHYEEAPYDLFALNLRFDTWWYRAWTFQEATGKHTSFSDLTRIEQALAKRILFHSGNNVFTDKDLEDYIESVRLHLFSADACCRGVFDKPGTRNLAKTAFSSPYIHLTHILDSRRMRTQRTEDLVSLILDNGIRSATDPRDLVNGFVGLAVNPPSDLIRYDLPPHEWVIHVTGSLIRHSQSLDALRHVTADQDEHGAPLQRNCAQRGVKNDWLRMNNLPSWCPDWTQATRLRHFQERSQRRLILKDRFAAAKGTTADAKIRNNTVLEVSGILSDSVASVGKLSDRSQVPNNACLLQWSRLVANSPAIHDATCDGCSKTICGVRHKCKICPDFDLCHPCFLGAEGIHPDHAFKHLQPDCSVEEIDSETDEDSDSVTTDGQQHTQDSVWRDLD